MIPRFRGLFSLLTLFLAVPACLSAVPAAAQTTGAVTGRAVMPDGTPVPNAIVILEAGAASWSAVSDDDGTFSVTGVPLGPYHLTVRGDGFLPTRVDVTVSAGAAPLEVVMAADPHFSEVVSVSPDARSQFDSYQPTSVLGGQDLARQLRGTIGATLENQPGVATRSFGPGPARPVIRGFDGDRVLVLEDGQRMGDLSSQSGDHGVNIDAASASKIEVVRGPATLLYGANAIGGLVNVITNDIPTAPIDGATGSVKMDLGSAAGQAGAAGDITAGRGHLALHLSSSGSRSSAYSSPDGEVPNSFRRAGAIAGALSYVTDNGYVGGSVGYDRSHYGIPFVEEGETNLDPRRRFVHLRAERRQLSGPIDSFRLAANIVRYRHDELDGEEIATRFVNDTSEVTGLFNHRPAGVLEGTLGAQVLTRSFSATGEEALSPPVDQKTVSAFLYEEAAVSPHVSFQFGGRVDHTGDTPREEYADRTFTNASGSVGLLVHTTEATTLAFSLAHASRNPALEELYFHGEHAGNASIENGDDQLNSERALGFDASFRWQLPRASGEVTGFYNRVDDYIYRALTGEVDDEAGLPVTFFSQGNATIAGFESHLDVHVTDVLWIEGGLDYVHGQLTSADVPLPRMPPLRGQLGLRYQRGAFQAGVHGTSTATQDRVFTVPTPEGLVGETSTAGYTRVSADAAYSFLSGRTTHTIAVRLENAGNIAYRNHLDFLKEYVPEMGRDLRVVYSVDF